MLRIVHTIIVGLIGAGIVHGAVVILVPRAGDQSLWNRLQQVAPQGKFTTLAPQLVESARLAPGDPHVEIAVCLFSVTETPVRIRAEGFIPFWSISVFSGEGYNLYSYNDRSANQSNLDLLVATPLQMIELRKASPQDVQETVTFERELTDTFVVLRVLKPDASWGDLTSRFLASATCEPYIIEARSDPAVGPETDGTDDAPAETPSN